MRVLGIDIGGSSIKYGVVNFAPATLALEFFDRKEVTFDDSPDTYYQAITGLISDCAVDGVVGIDMPTIIKKGRICAEKSRFKGVFDRFFDEFMIGSRYQVHILNDADAAGYAEVWRPEAIELRVGVTLLITLGTGIGSAIFTDGILVPNTEMAYLRMHGLWAEEYMASSVIQKENLSLDAWVLRLNEYLVDIERLLNPDTIVLGGGISEDFEKYADQLQSYAKIIPAFYRNQAGVIGSACYALKHLK